jgi:predicted metal-dependent hydrolase
LSIPHHPGPSRQQPATQPAPDPAQATHDSSARTAIRGQAARGTHLDTDQVGLIQLDGRPIEYTMRRSVRRKRAMLSLSDRGLMLAVPLRMSSRAIEDFLQLSHPWLRRHLPRWQASARPHLELDTLQQVLWMGESLRVDPVATDVAAADASRVDRQTTSVTVSLPDPGDFASLRLALRGWIQGQALPHFTERARYFAPVVGVGLPPIKLTEARTLWGSCTPKGLVRLNWRLMQAPPHLIDYVVVHELAHLLEPNHSSRFWAVVERGCREHRGARRELSQWQRRLAAL